MYYTVEEISQALSTAKTIINDRTKTVKNYSRGYNDCWALLVEYDKALRKDNSNFQEFANLQYKSAIEFFIKVTRMGYKNYDELAKRNNYKVITNQRPEHGDIAFEILRDRIGTAMIAENGSWVSTSEFNLGVIIRRPIKVKESINLLARPIKG